MSNVELSADEIREALARYFFEKDIGRGTTDAEWQIIVNWEVLNSRQINHNDSLLKSIYSEADQVIYRLPSNSLVA